MLTGVRRACHLDFSRSVGVVEKRLSASLVPTATFSSRTCRFCWQHDETTNFTERKASFQFTRNATAAHQFHIRETPVSLFPAASLFEEELR